MLFCSFFFFIRLDNASEQIVIFFLFLLCYYRKSYSVERNYVFIITYLYIKIHNAVLRILNLIWNRGLWENTGFPLVKNKNDANDDETNLEE